MTQLKTYCQACHYIFMIAIVISPGSIFLKIILGFTSTSNPLKFDKIISLASQILCPSFLIKAIPNFDPLLGIIGGNNNDKMLTVIIWLGFPLSLGRFLISS